jgi:hypothetical protein
VVAVVIAAPLSIVGLKHLMDESIKAEFDRGSRSPDSPLVKLRSGFDSFSSTLKATLDGQVDSATFKMLRFGCNEYDHRLAPNFPGCVKQSHGAAVAQAQSAVDEDEQTIAFAGRTAQQKVTLSIALRPVDPPDVLHRVALEIEWTPLDVAKVGASSKSRRKLKLAKANVAELGRGFFLEEATAFALYGVAESMSEQALNATIDITDALKDIPGNLHQLRIRAVKNPNSDEPINGTERFFLRAVISVNHKVQLPS